MNLVNIGFTVSIAFIADLMLGSTPVLASEQRIQDRTKFENLVDALELRRPFISLRVTRDGNITGRAFGRYVSGNWTWEDTFFCRSMTWGQKEIDYNCQEVRVTGNRLIFQSDRGTGDQADFNIIDPNR
jgi:hypothetical protein